MNWRNRQIFGGSFGRPSFRLNKLHIITFIILLAVGSFAWFFFDDTSSQVKILEKNELTGAAITQQEAPQEEVITDVDEEVLPEERPFYEYKEECAKDMRQRQDDLEDINTRIEDFNTALEDLNNEYQQKIEELENEYQVPLDNAEAKKEKAEREISAILERWADRKVYCDNKYPA